MARHIEGTGLGLAITQQIVNLMGGTLSVASRLGQGSTFTVALRLLACEGANVDAEGTSRQRIGGYEGDRRTVLLVDRRWENRAVLRSLLQSVGFLTLEAGDAQEGLRALATQSVDLMVVDGDILATEGGEAIAQARAKGLPILGAVTPAAADHDGWISGCDDVLRQPIQADEVLAKLQQCLGLRWRYDPTAVDVGVSPSELVYPEAMELEKLHRLAGKGRIAAIEEATRRLEQADGRYRPFAARLREISQTFDLTKIQTFLQAPP
ncbi:MAG: hypothetical protein HC918_05400 [Oscillatoriales cyanobacterium SM2_1_8]|nr:hypothetical protein [Oscillatoriales cyanobacterium SM2_1_8]